MYMGSDFATLIIIENLPRQVWVLHRGRFSGSAEL